MTVPNPEEGIRAQCRAILARVRELRQFERPKAGASPPDVHEAMVEVRGRLDQIEELLARLIDLRSSARIAAATTEHAHQEAWDRRATDLPKAGMGPEYQGKEERYARWNLDTLPQLIASRQARRVADFIGGIEEQARLFYYGMVKLQDELKTTLRYLPWQDSQLDR